MKKTRFTEERKHFGTLEPTDIKRLRQLEHENGRTIAIRCGKLNTLVNYVEGPNKSGRSSQVPKLL